MQALKSPSSKLLLLFLIAAISLFAEKGKLNLQAFSSRSDERIAICISGAARTFQYGGVHIPIQQHIIEPLKRSYQTDVFFVIRFGDDPNRGRRKVSTSDADTLKAINSYNPVRIMICKDKIENLNMSKRYKKGEEGGAFIYAPEKCHFRPFEASERDFPMALYRTKQCMNEIEAYEKENQFQYDWIYRIRTDVVLFEDIIKPNRLSKDKFYMDLRTPQDSIGFANWWKDFNKTDKEDDGPVDDLIFIASRKIANITFHAFDMFHDCLVYNIPDNRVENALRMFLVVNQIPYQSFSWKYTIVREGGPTWGHFRYYDIDHLSEERKREFCNRYLRKWRNQLPPSSPEKCIV